MFFDLRKIRNYVTIEPYIFFMALSYSGPIEQMQQDKLCLQTFRQSIDYCLNVSESKTSEMKLSILSQSNTLSLYATITYTTFGVIWCLLIGCLCDKHVKLRKPFLIMAAGSFLFENILGMFQVVFFNELGIKMIIASNILPAFIGSYEVGLTLSYAYIATHSTEANRALKYFTFHITYIIASAIGSLLSGQLLGYSSWIRGDEIRNYSSMYIIGIFSAICSILWISFAVESIDKLAPNENNPAEDNPEENNNDNEKEKINYWLMIKEIFDVKEIVLSLQERAGQTQQRHPTSDPNFNLCHSCVAVGTDRNGRDIVQLHSAHLSMGFRNVFHRVNGVVGDWYCCVHDRPSSLYENIQVL